MDLSSLPESDQQKLIPQQQQQQQQQQSNDQDFYYNPIQTQQQQQQQQQQPSYDQIYYSYNYQQFPPPLQQSQNQLQQQQHHFYYYQADYEVAHQPPLPHHHQHHHHHHDHRSVSAAPVGSAPQMSVSDGAAASALGQQFHHQPTAVVPAGLNPAAAAAVTALAQLTEFAGTMELAERAAVGFQTMGAGFGPGPVRRLAGQHPNTRRGGRRVRGSLQGHHRGSFGDTRVSKPPFHVTGRGKRKVHSRCFQQKGATAASSCPKPSAAPDAELTIEVAHLSTRAPEDSVHSVLASMKAAPNDQPPRMAWCELCRVDCNSLQILEQHKNGKRHKKNLVRIESLQNAIKPLSQVQHDQTHLNDPKSEVAQLESIQNGEVQEPKENLPSEVVNDEYRLESNQQNNVQEKPEVPVEESANPQVRKSGMDRLDKKRHGMKRKMKNGQRGKSTKRSKASKSSRQPKEPPKPKVAVPVICDLCNVECDTREVFDRHLSGKKHIAKLKRFESHQVMYGPKGLQALYPPNSIVQTPFIHQSHQPCYGPPGTLLQPGGYFPLQAHQAAPATTCLDVQPLQSFMPQQFTFESDSHDIAQQQVATKQPEIKQNVVPETIPASTSWNA